MGPVHIYQQTLLLAIFGFWATLFVGVYGEDQSCLVDVDGKCGGGEWILVPGDKCVLITDDRGKYKDAAETCKNKGAMLLSHEDMPKATRQCLLSRHPKQKHPMIWVQSVPTGKKSCKYFNLKDVGVRTPGCGRVRFYACQKDAMMPTADPMTDSPSETTTTKTTTELTTTTTTTTTTTAKPLPPQTTTAAMTEAPTTHEMIFEETSEDPFIEETSTHRSQETTDDDDSSRQTDSMSKESTESMPRTDSGTQSTMEMLETSTDESTDSYGITDPNTTQSPDATEPENESTEGDMSDVTDSAGSATQDTIASTQDMDMTKQDPFLYDPNDPIFSFNATYAPHPNSTSAGEENPKDTDMQQETTAAPVQTPIGELHPRCSLPTGRPECEDGWLPFNKSLCLQVNPEPKGSHSDAKYECIDKGGVLVLPADLTEDVVFCLGESLSNTSTGSATLRLADGKCLNLADKTIAVCASDLSLGFICSINHAPVSEGSTMGAAPMAGMTLAATSVAILVYHTMKTRMTS